PTLVAPEMDDSPIRKSFAMNPTSLKRDNVDEGVSESTGDNVDVEEAETSQGEPAEESVDGSTSESTDENGDVEVSDRITRSDMFNDRRRGPDSESISRVSDPAATERIAELIRKKTNKTWYDLYLPYILCGVGALIAYQFGKGFGSNELED
ncbi:MAG: hypothetical protein AAGA30_20470, partial [Planctomycetota bacterium]